MNNTQIYAFSASVYELSRIAKLAINVIEQLKPDTIRLGKTSYLNILLDSLVSQQFPDGSWGSPAYSFGDRLINTLSAVTALAFNKQRWADLSENSFFPRNYQQSFRAGIAWLEANVLILEWYNPDKDDLADLAGLELMVYALREELISYQDELSELSTLVLHLNQLSASAPILRKARIKLQLVPRELVFEPGSAISYILEFTNFLVQADQNELAGALTARGSIGNSPSTTAFVLDHSWDVLTPAQREQILAYLREGAADSQQTTGQPGWGSHYPMNHFLEIWHKYYLKQLKDLHEPNDSRQMESVPDFELLNTIEQQSRMGFGADYDFQIDADTTAAFVYLAAADMVQTGQTGRLFSLLECMLEFFDAKKGYFLTYPFELTPSVTTNVHVWQALNVFLQLAEQGSFDSTVLPSTLQPARLQEIKASLVTYIKGQFKGENLWQDKWHMTPSYATSHIVASGLLEEADGFLLINQVVRTLLKAQSPIDGGWGYVKLQDNNAKTPEKKSNPDDTLHVLLLLLYSLKNKNFTSNTTNTPGEAVQLLPAIGNAIFRALAYLSPVVEQANPASWPAVWCDKTLYSPYGLLQMVAEELLDQLNARKLTKWQVA